MPVNTNTAQHLQALSDVSSVIESAAELVLSDAALNVRDAVAADWPVDTGDSLEAWIAVGPEVRNDLDYASYVGDGLAFQLVEGAIEEQTPTIEAQLCAIVIDSLEVA